jgi:hypothetical protein
MHGTCQDDAAQTDKTNGLLTSESTPSCDFGEKSRPQGTARYGVLVEIANYAPR